MNTFGQRIESARGKTSREALAQEVGVSASTVQRWEKGRNEPNVGDLVKLAAALGVSVEWLATGKEPTRYKKPSAAEAAEGYGHLINPYGPGQGSPPLGVEEASAEADAGAMSGRSVRPDDVPAAEPGHGPAEYPFQQIRSGEELILSISIIVRGREEPIVIDVGSSLRGAVEKNPDSR